MAKQNRKKRAATRIRSIRSKLDSSDTREHLQTFITQYFLCEMACKEMMVGYKDDFGKPITYEEAKMDLRTLKAAFNHYGITISDDVRNRLFSANASSAKELRNSIVHGISKKNLDTLNANYVQLMADMNSFLGVVER